MKRIVTLLLAVLFCAPLWNCKKTPDPLPEPSEEPSASPSDEPSAEPSADPSADVSSDPSADEVWGEVTDPMGMEKGAVSVWQKAYADEVFTGPDHIHYMKFFHNGAYTKDLSLSAGTGDNRYEFYRNTRMRYVSCSDGYALTVPREGLEMDYTLAKYGMLFNFTDARLRVTLETVRPYSHDAHGYGIYTGEWLDRYVDRQLYMNLNNMRYNHPKVNESRDYLPGYVVTIWSVQINEPGEIEFPFYKIAIIRPDGQYGRFGLLLYKSKTDQAEEFEAIAKSFRVFAARGGSRNYLPEQEPKDDPHWNEETRAYYHKLLNQKTLDFGAFVATLPFDSQTDIYESQRARFLSEKTRLEGADGWNHNWEIVPTYCHISWYSDLHYFPCTMAREVAGGNGFNGKPVLQFTYQFTTDNNRVSSQDPQGCRTPMWNILRGKYDDHFRQLAEDIKAYGAPVLFRLNNEMNSDWTSYCGMMTLLDPEIFRLTWQRLYKIFVENGVDNVIWIWNPNAVSCPYSNWGEDLPYYPGNDYVQILGLTSYEMNNNGSPTSFRDHYTSLYEKNKVLFSRMPCIIGEFACGAGGDTSGVLKRNQDSQARWVEAMFDDFADRENHPYLQQIKGAVWFSCNDYSGDKVINQLALDADLTETLRAFREGFAKLE